VFGIMDGVGTFSQLGGLDLDSELRIDTTRSPLILATGVPTRICLLRVGWLGSFSFGYGWLALCVAESIRNLAFAGCRGHVRWIPFPFSSSVFSACVSLIMDRPKETAIGYPAVEASIVEGQKYRDSISGRRASCVFFSLCGIARGRAFSFEFCFSRGGNTGLRCFCEGTGEGERQMCV